MMQTDPNIQLLLEEVESIDLRLARLKAQRAQAIENLTPHFSVPTGQESGITNIGDFKITKKEGLSYTLNKKQFNALPTDQQTELKMLGVVQDDVKLSLSALKKNLENNTPLMSNCITAETKTSLEIKKGK